MNGKTLAELALKVWAVILIVGAMTSAPGVVWGLRPLSGSDPQAVLVHEMEIAQLINVLAGALVGLALLIWADRVVSLFEGDSAPLRIRVKAREAQVLVFAMIGLYVVVQGLQNVAGGVYVLAMKPPLAGSDPFSYVWDRQGEAMVKAAVQIVAGTVLVVGRTALARGFSRLRSFPAAS